MCVCVIRPHCARQYHPDCLKSTLGFYSFSVCSKSLCWSCYGTLCVRFLVRPCILLYLWLFNRIVRWQPDRPASRVYIGQIEPVRSILLLFPPAAEGGNGFHDIFHSPMLHRYVVQEDLVCYVLTRKRLTNPFFFGGEGVSFFFSFRSHVGNACVTHFITLHSGTTHRWHYTNQKIKRSIWGVRQMAHTGGGGTPENLVHVFPLLPFIVSMLSIQRARENL